MKKVVFVYGLDYCSHTTALYIDGNKITDDMRGGELEVLDALLPTGYKVPEFQVNQEWIDNLGWVFPDKLEDVQLK